MHLDTRRGFTVIALFLAIGCQSSAGPSTTTAAANRSPNVITQQEIQAASGVNAYDLVSRLRPNWLRATGTGSISGATPRMQVTIVVLDGVRLGGIEALRTVSAGGITSMRFLTAERAAATISDVGMEPISGAIVISTR